MASNLKIITTKEFKKSHELYSSNNDSFFGSYIHKYLQVNLNCNYDDPELLIENKNYSDLQHRANVILRSLSLFHEMKHFHDCFGTLSGINLIGQYLEELKEFILFCNEVIINKLQWKFPFSTMTKSPDCPDFIKKFQKNIKNRKSIQSISNGGIIFNEEEGHSKEVFHKLFVPNVTKRTIYCFPIKLLKRVFDSAGELSNMQYTTALYSIGFETLLESNANSFQKSFIEGFCDDEVQIEIMKLLRTDDTKISTHASKKIPKINNSTIKPYEVLDFLLSKYMISNFKISSFDRIILNQIVDNALNESIFEYLKSFDTLMSPGEAFIQNLLSSDLNKNLVKKSLINTKYYIDLKSTLSNSRKEIIINTEKHVLDLNKTIYNIESFIHHKIVIPLIDIRLNYGNDCFHDPSKFLLRFKEFPKPFITTYKDKIEFHPEANKIMKDSWVEYVFLLEILDQIKNDNEILYCPRAYLTVEGIELFDCSGSLSESCDDNFKSGKCGTWNNFSKDKKLPSCLYYNILKNLGINTNDL